MAEEANLSEQEQATEPVTPPQTQEAAPDLSFLKYLPESVKLPAKPSAIDYYNKAVGNPLTGTDPVLKNPTANKSSIMDSAIAKVQTLENPYAALKPFTYSGDFDKTKFERYYSAKDAYNKLGFNPYVDNESLYNRNMTFGDQFVRAASQWDNLVASGFMSGVRSWKTLFTDPLAPDIEGAREMERIMELGANNTGGIGGFVTNTFLNSGYTVGIGLNFLGEELALMGATALTGGAAGAVGIPAMVARGTSALNKIFEGSKIIGKGLKNLTRMDGVRAINSIPEARSFWSTVGKGASTIGKGVFEVVNPLENTYQALKATDYATDFAKVSKTFGAFADDILMMKNTVAEAKIEGGLVKLNSTEELINEYVSRTGKQPTGKDLEDIEKIATDKAYQTAALNLPAIALTNKLMYATMLAPLRNVMGKEAVPLLEEIVFNKKTFGELGEGLLQKGAAAAKSLANPKFYGQFGMNYLKANLAEGVQENLQEAISAGAIAHAKALYNDPIRASHDGFMPHLMDGLKKQFSAQGAETFASGFLMGAFAQPIMTIPSIGISKLVNAFDSKNYEKLKTLKKEARKRDIDILNEQYQSPLDFYAPDLANAVKTGRLADDMYAAGRAGDKKGAMDAQASIQNNHMITAFRTGKYDIIRKRLADFENFTAQETIEAFKKYGIEEKDYESASAKIKEVIARADRTKETYESVAKKYPNPINVSSYKQGTPERVAAELSKIAWDEAVQNLVFAHATIDSHSKRIAGIAQTFSKISQDLAGEDAQSLMSMLSREGLAKEVMALKNELAALSDDIPAQKKIKNKKEKQIEKIEDYYVAVKEIEEAKTPEEKAKAEEKAKKKFLDYVKFLGNKNDTLLFNDSLEDAYNMIKDSMLLKDDVKGLVDSINVLMTPQNFLNLHARLFTVHNEAFQNKKKIIEENVNTHDKIQDLNGALKAIYQESKLTLSDESLNAIKEAEDKGLNYPETVTFVDENNNPITAGPEFDKAMKAWKVLLDVTKKEIKEEKPAETTTTEGEEQEEELEPFDKNDVNTYPKSLLSDLEEMYELYQDAGLISEKETFPMFLKSQTAKTIIQYAELKVKEQQERKEAAEKAAKEKEAGEAPTTGETTPTSTSTLGFENLGKIGNQGLAIIEADINKSGKHVISNISRATPEQKTKIDSDIEELKKKYPEKNITSRIEGSNLIVEVSKVTTPAPTTTTTDARADIERRRQEELEKSLALVQIGVKAPGFFTSPYVENEVGNSDKVIAIKSILKSLEQLNKQNKLDELQKSKFEELKEINAKYDAEYVDAVKKGTMTREQAMQALEEVGRKDSGAYAELAALKGKPAGITAETKTDVKLSPTDKIIWGHPTIGKSFLKKQGENRFITLDDDYKDEVNAFVDANRGSETRQEYKGRKPKEYNEFMLALYDRLKVQAKKEGKILFVSNTNILKERMSDFDKVINIPKEEFKKRFDARGAKYGFEDWKSDIDATISKVPADKVINTTGYLSDLLPVQSQGKQGKLFEEPGITFEVGDRVKINTAKDGESIIKEDRGDKVLLEDGRQVAKKNLAKIEGGKSIINPQYVGSLIYVTPTSKTEIANVIDTDDLLLEAILEENPNMDLNYYKNTYKDLYNWKGQAIFDAIVNYKIDGDKLRSKVLAKVKELLKEGKTVITSTKDYISSADYVMIQVTPTINNNIPGYSIKKEIEVANDKNKPIILIDNYDYQALTNTPKELSDKDIQFISEDSNITAEDINKEINSKSLTIAMEKQYDAVYKNKRYAITNVTQKYVYLTSINGEKITAEISDITSVIDPNGKQATTEDIKTFKENETTIESGNIEIDFDETDINKVIKNILDNICKNGNNL